MEYLQCQNCKFLIEEHVDALNHVRIVYACKHKAHEQPIKEISFCGEYSYVGGSEYRRSSPQ